MGAQSLRMLSPVVLFLQVSLLCVLETEAGPLEIQTFLVETDTSVLCREGVCISEDPDKDKCPVDFFEDECPGYREYCGLSSHRGKWMLLFCKHTCHCNTAKAGDSCCHHETEDHKDSKDNNDDSNSVEEPNSSEDESKTTSKY